MKPSILPLMAIVDYERVAKRAREKLFDNAKISAQNKAYVERYEKRYDVSPARKGLFYKHIEKVLERTPDIVKTMNNRDEVNTLFAELRKELGSNYYATVVSVTKTFVKWLNDGDAPKGFKDLKSVRKKSLLRGLRRDDMITWEDGLLLADNTTSMQLKAIILMQLDGGFRPSEFIELNYGDVEVKDEMIIVHVTRGKTGARDVLLWRCVPYLLKWLDLHPVKKKDAPLWVIENAGYSHRREGKVKLGERYKYYAIRQRILKLGAKVGLNKPLDFYNFRHSSCFLDKMDNVPVDIAAKKHGHSVEFYTETYARLDVDDDLRRVKAHYGGVVEEEKPKINNVTCKRCRTINEPNAEVCTSCGMSLTLKKALEKEDELRVLQKKMDVIISHLADKADTEVKERLQKA